jgi:hypothetical protein
LQELKKQFEELLGAYRDFHTSPEHHDHSKEARVSVNDRPGLQKKAELALQMFKSCFGKRLNSRPDILSSTSFEHTIATMVEWASQLLPRRAERKAFETTEECSSWLTGVVSQTSETQSSFSNRDFPTCWPFIQKVQVYLKAYILSKGLILADLPGLRDVNSVRETITERYMRQCHQIFVVTEIKRAITNESIKHVCDLASHLSLSKVDIVCTHSEDIHTRQAADDWPAERATIKDLQTAIAAEERHMDDFDDDQSYPKYREAQKAKERHELKLKQLIGSLRNDKVSRGLKEQYRNHPVAGSLRVFCVSNKVYEDYREKAANIALPYLDFSGILELRRYCIGVVAQSRLQAIQSFIKDKIPALIGSVELWVEAGAGDASAEDKQQVLDAVSTMQQRLEKVRNFLFVR